MAKKVINILGVTGSIGQSTVDVILAHPDRFEVGVISAHLNKDKLLDFKERLDARRAICTQDEDLEAALCDVPADITVSAITGFAGLRPLLKAIETSKAVAVANKEPLVAAGALVLETCRRHGTTLLPIDSEHNAVFQVFDEARRHSIESIILTASGGPFLNHTLEQMAVATPEQAVAHPNWSMGQKISVDSATMMNKALEIIEAHVLFDLPPEKIDVLVHPQSVVHGMVEYVDGSVLAQMGASDMRTPIANILDWPDRLATPGKKLDLKTLGDLTFNAVDAARFPAIGLAYACIQKGAYACIAMNAANEVAVDAFLKKEIGFLDIVRCVRHSLEDCEAQVFDSLNAIEEYDGLIRENTANFIANGLTEETVQAV